MEKTIEIPEGYEARIKGNRVIFEPKESKDERIRNFLIDKFRKIGEVWHEYSTKDIIAWLEKQGEHKPIPFKVEHGKYYYCIKDYFSGGKKQVSKGDVVQALRGLPIMGLDDASEHFLPVNNVQNPAWSEEDEANLQFAIEDFQFCVDNNQFPVVYNTEKHKEVLASLKLLKERYTWKPLGIH